MARKPRISTRLSAASLVRLGAPRLAELLVEATAGNANLKRRLRLELAAEMGPETLALEIDKRITAISTARTRVSWRKRGELIDDLNTHRRMILERLAPVAPGEALAVLVRWFDLYPARHRPQLACLSYPHTPAGGSSRPFGRPKVLWQPPDPPSFPPSSALMRGPVSARSEIGGLCLFSCYLFFGMVAVVALHWVKPRVHWL